MNQLCVLVPASGSERRSVGPEVPERGWSSIAIDRPLGRQAPASKPAVVAADIGHADACPCEAALTPTAAPAPRTSP